MGEAAEASEISDGPSFRRPPIFPDFIIASSLSRQRKPLPSCSSYSSDGNIVSLAMNTSEGYLYVLL